MILILAIVLLLLLGLSILLMPLGKAQTRKRNAAERFGDGPPE